MTALSPSSTIARSPISVLRHAWTSSMRAPSSASRSGAAKSVASNTPCTNVPTCTPEGISARRDGTSRSAVSPASTTGGGPATSSSSVTSRSSGSLATRASWAPAVMSL
jgi:hypothetical protein